MGKSKLKLALAAEKGTDFTKIKEKRQKKATLKAKEVDEEKREQEESQDDEAEEVEEGSEDDEEFGNGVRRH